MNRESKTSPIDEYSYVTANHLLPNGKYNISPSTVVEVFLAEYPRSYPGSRRGKQEHQRIIQSIINSNTSEMVGYEVPPIPFDIPVGEAQGEKRVYAQITDNLTLSAQYDGLIDKNITVEIKPTFKDYHTIQTVLTCMAVAKSQNLDKVHGMLHCYEENQTWVLPDGASDIWPLTVQVCELSQQIKYVQTLVTDQLEKRGNKPTQLEFLSGNQYGILPEEEFVALNNYEIKKRREYRPLVKEMLGELNHRFIRKF